MAFKILLFFAILCNCCISAPCHADEKKVKKFFNVSSHGRGMFCCVLTVLGLADCYEKGEIAGFNIDYSNHGSYYEPELGPNWWIYYFAPLCVGDSTEANGVKTVTGYPRGFAVHAECKLSRSRCNELLKKYIRIKPKFIKEVNRFVNQHFNSAEFVIGVHYRGTDKIRESPRASYELMESEIRDVIRKQCLVSPKIFVATDEQGFLEFMQAQFPVQIVATEALRSVDETTPLHKAEGNKFRKGKEALIDCLLLSKCDLLIRTSSNLSLCSTFFNVNLPVIEVSKRYGKK